MSPDDVSLEVAGLGADKVTAPLVTPEHPALMLTPPMVQERPLTRVAGAARQTEEPPDLTHNAGWLGGDDVSRI